MQSMINHKLSGCLSYWQDRMIFDFFGCRVYNNFEILQTIKPIIVYVKYKFKILPLYRIQYLWEQTFYEQSSDEYGYNNLNQIIICLLRTRPNEKERETEEFSSFSDICKS